MGNDSYNIMSGPFRPGDASQIGSGQYMIDCTNNQWVLSTPYTIDGGSPFKPTRFQSIYGSNGRGLHKLQASGSTFYLDDTTPGLIPANAVLQVYAQTWDGGNCTNVYASRWALPCRSPSLNQATHLRVLLLKFTMMAVHLRQKSMTITQNAENYPM